MADKIKTGIEVTRKDNGETWYCERDRQDGTVLLRDTPNKAITATLFDTTLSNITIARKTVKSLKTKPKAITDSTKAEKQMLNTFFDKVALKIPANCMNCGQPLQAWNKFAKRSVCCHIIPKSQFPTVASNPENIVYMGVGYLGGCDCHSQYDSNVGNRIKMDIYDTALKRFYKSLMHLLTEKEKIKAFTYLNIDWQ